MVPSPQSECAICMVELCGTSGQGCPNNHTFHVVCILEWLKRERSCPLCREHISCLTVNEAGCGRSLIELPPTPPGSPANDEIENMLCENVRTSLRSIVNPHGEESEESSEDDYETEDESNSEEETENNNGQVEFSNDEAQDDFVLDAVDQPGPSRQPPVESANSAHKRIYETSKEKRQTRKADEETEKSAKVDAEIDAEANFSENDKRLQRHPEKDSRGDKRKPEVEHLLQCSITIRESTHQLMSQMFSPMLPSTANTGGIDPALLGMLSGAPATVPFTVANLNAIPMPVAPPPPPPLSHAPTISKSGPLRTNDDSLAEMDISPQTSGRDNIEQKHENGNSEEGDKARLRNDADKEMKKALIPYFRNKKITKEEYKTLMKRGVYKLSFGDRTARLDAERAELLNVLRAETLTKGEHEWSEMANLKLDMYERSLMHLELAKNKVKRVRSVSDSFFYSFTLLTTIGAVDTNGMSFEAKLFSIFYAIFGVPLTLLYLSQCAKLITSLISEKNILSGTAIAILLIAILYDIFEQGSDDTPFVDAVLSAFLITTTIGEVGHPVRGWFVYTVALVSLSLCSFAFVQIQRDIERRLQGCELLFSQTLAHFERWLARDYANEDRIIEEDEEEDSYTLESGN
ncbi:hypothetical protein QR680_001753 [Steinernema hermaphroditum]|uniref:RING-type domain-containing protein n=1 Tax=Steinernema hermaphroditum TaxID=289476 RepID=A0AA39LGM3_9BILA|nr:hypothetical protein QR680_001753 [Steinernema hermaphroditum]